MFAQFLTTPYLPFAISFVVMIGIGLIEAVGLGLGNLDGDAGIEHGTETGFLDWLGIGEIPVLIWLTSLLGCFTLAGLAVQQVAASLTGAPLQWAIASVGALVAGVPLNTLVANGLARIMPGFETTAISTEGLLRHRGTILEGVARRGSPARAKVIDQHGQAHVVMVEPHEDFDVIASGETALLVRREGRLFFAVPDKSTTFQSV